MAQSRYENFAQVRTNSKDYYRLETFPSINAQDLSHVPHSVIMWKETDRMDALAEGHLGNASYWWVICLMNDLVNPFSYKLLPGTLLKIPHEARAILNIIQRKRESK